MASSIRRVVTGHDKSGKAVVAIDGPAPNVRIRAGARSASTLLWVEDATPADNSDGGDKADRQIGVAPPPTGSIFRIVEFAPEPPGGPAISNEQMKAEMGLHAHGGPPPRHPYMHRTETVDYAIVMDGEIDMLMDEAKDDVHLKAGDVVVQRGTNHAWANRSGKPCRIAFILIDAKPLKGGPA